MLEIVTIVDSSEVLGKVLGFSGELTYVNDEEKLVLINYFRMLFHNDEEWSVILNYLTRVELFWNRELCQGFSDCNVSCFTRT